jgi:hypothetical protein
MFGSDKGLDLLLRPLKNEILVGSNEYFIFNGVFGVGTHLSLAYLVQ